jgi:hypothetical protein
MTMEEKRFIKPEAEVVEFDNSDIIVTSTDVCDVDDTYIE